METFHSKDAGSLGHSEAAISLQSEYLKLAADKKTVADKAPQPAPVEPHRPKIPVIEADHVPTPEDIKKAKDALGIK